MLHPTVNGHAYRPPCRQARWLYSSVALFPFGIKLWQIGVGTVQIVWRFCQLAPGSQSRTSARPKPLKTWTILGPQLPRNSRGEHLANFWPTSARCFPRAQLLPTCDKRRKIAYYTTGQKNDWTTAALRLRQMLGHRPITQGHNGNNLQKYVLVVHFGLSHEGGTR